MKDWRDYIFYEDEWVTLLVGDVREIAPLLPASIAQTTITSPPYFGLRDYSTAQWEGGNPECEHKGDQRYYTMRGASSSTSEAFSEAGEANSVRLKKARWREKGTCISCGAVYTDSQIGLEPTPAEFVAAMIAVFDDTKRVLKDDGTAWINLGDSYSNDDKWGGSTGGKHVKELHGNTGIGRQKRATGYKPKDLMLIPFDVAAALRNAGWWLRNWFPWVKRSAMPDSARDRAGNSLEVIFHLAKGKYCFYDLEAVRRTQAPDQAKRVRCDRIGGSNGHTVRHSEGGMYVQNRDRSNGNRNGECGHLDETPAGSRNFRNADLWFESVKPPHGLTGVGNDIVGIDVNSAGFSAEFCTACERYYHDAKDKKQIRVVTTGDVVVRECICGRSDAWLSHFATFAPKLIEPFIKCGTSEAGECPECGKAWVRKTEPSAEYAKYLGKGYHNHSADIGQGLQQLRNTNQQNKMRDETGKRSAEYVTIGFFPQCTCNNAPAIPQTVFEPFSGAGTTMIAAAKLGRRCIAIELNPDYAAMSVERYKREMRMPVDPPRREEAMPLFAMEVTA